MDYAVNNWIYADEDLRTTLDRLHRFGYDRIELLGEPSQYDPSEVRTLCDEFDLKPSSVLSWCLDAIGGRDLAHPEETARDKAIQYGQSCIDLAVDIRAPIVVVIPASAGRTAPRGNPTTESEWKAQRDAEWRASVDSVRQLAKYAAERGVTLAVEPINRYETFLVQTLRDALAFLDDVNSDHVQIHLDTFHMNLEESDLAETIREAGDRLVNLHVADSNREAPGRGHIDFPSIMSVLDDIDYDRALVLEPVPPGSDPFLAIRMSENVPLRDVYAEESIRHLKRSQREAQS